MVWTNHGAGGGVQQLAPDRASRLHRLTAKVGASAVLDSLTFDEQQSLLYDFSWWGRPAQATRRMALGPRGCFLAVAVLARLGAAAEWVRLKVESGAQRIGLVSRVPRDAREVMVGGESGLMSVFPPEQRPLYEPSKRLVTFHTGATASIYSSEKPDELRGPQHDVLWWDELATFRTRDAWDNGQLGLRVGRHPQQVRHDDAASGGRAP